ncbi:hypothetical protein [Collinsella aerofaciens]|uniref:hypothetical protein n=1 Tax=Collinsella aerofaciens TaxID=74426 RepID=UPI00189E91B4|nr:hypothetical protein [Collinsella aerofaciens]
MTVPVPSQPEQKRYAQEHEAKQRSYEDALKKAEHYAASKGTMQGWDRQPAWTFPGSLPIGRAVQCSG